MWNIGLGAEVSQQQGEVVLREMRLIYGRSDTRHGGEGDRLQRVRCDAEEDRPTYPCDPVLTQKMTTVIG